MKVTHVFPAGWRSVEGATCSVQPEKWAWFVRDAVSYLLYDDPVSLQGARCACASLPDARLAVFRDGDDYSGVGDFLTRHHSSDQFWVDAQREANCECARMFFIW